MAMIKKLLFTLSLCMMVGSVLYAQSTIKGVVKDPSGNPIPYLQILLKQEGKVINGAMTDDNGNYQIFGIFSGTYDIGTNAAINCPTPFTQTGIYVSSSEVKFVNLTINCSSTELEEIVVEWQNPIFNADNTKSSITISGDDVRRTPGRSITAALSNLEGVASVDGSMTSVRGARSDGQQMIIDGVRVRGNTGVVMQSVEGLELIQGGIPAEFGDGTSFTVITTRGVSKDFHGGFGVQSSLEGYGQMLAEASISGPILKGKTPKDPARIGFMISAEGNYDIDDHPFRGGTWVAKPEIIDPKNPNSIVAKPVDYRYDGGYYTSTYRADELGSDAFKKIRVRQNAESWGFLAQAKIDFMGGGKDARGKSKNNLRFSLGGSYQYTSSLDWAPGQYWNQTALFNSKQNGVFISNTLRLHARLNHRVKTDTAANTILKNIMYDININYTLYNQKWYDRNHKDNVFAYGYIGKFTTERRDIYNVADSMQLYHINSIGDTLDSRKFYYTPYLDNYQSPMWVTFDQNAYLNNGNPYNPDLIPYTQNFIKFIFDKTGVDVNNISGGLNGAEAEEIARINRNKVYELLGFGSFTLPILPIYYALRNGDEPGNIGLGLYSAPGVRNSGYGKGRTETIGAKLSLSLNIQDHEIKFGFDLDKRTDRSYRIAPGGLWTLMRQLTTDSPLQLDLTNGYWLHGDPDYDFMYPLMETGIIVDTFMYNALPNTNYFDKQLRAFKEQQLGYKLVDGRQNPLYLDVDSYDPSEFRLNMFSNYELFNGGNSLISYSGYDYTGTPSKKKIDLNNFFRGTDENGNPNLHEQDKFAIGAFEPIYMALYLQDKFSISNLLFNVGLRVDYFNANQPVLRDPFLLKAAVKVGELRNETEWKNYLKNIPDNVSDDWVPYVSAADNTIATAPQDIVAYRNGKIWYNHLGQEVVDPSSYLGAGGPILVDVPEPGSKASGNAFTKYIPQWSVMPRISFSFPVSTTSLFYAHYNIITYRPTNLQINPIAYLFIDKYQSSNRIIANPNLRAQKTVDYEIGFRQKVGENAALNIAAYYREQRDQIQSYRFTGAYPNTYYSYQNQDFGTVQGFILGLEMRGTKNLSFRANYTLQFAKGTGSSVNSNLAIIASGQPNLRTLTNLSFDQRHNIGATIYLRFDQGVNYNGPVTVKQKKGTDTKKEIRWLENSGATLLLSAASGMPYSRSSTVISEIGWGGTRQLQGTINGANMPWIFKCDLRIDKSFSFNLANKNDKNENGQRKKKPGMLNVYLDFQNLLNLKNVTSVYDYTGSANDDGYLSSPLFHTQMTALTMPVSSAINYYEMMIANPLNFTQPFRVYLGLQFFF